MTKTTKSKLLEVRNKLKRKKPTFLRQDAHKTMKVPQKWTRPRGLQSKMRRNKKGYRRKLQVGWGSPVEVYGLSREGLNFVYVYNIKDLEKVNPQEDKIIIGGAVGLRKKSEIITEAIKKGIKIHNFKDPKKAVDEKIQQLSKKREQLTKKKSERETKKETDKKDAAKKEAEKKKKEDAKQAEEISEEDKQAAEKKEKDKMLISTT